MTNLIKVDHKYQILKNLGSGLSGEVFLVEDPHGQSVALKFLKKVQLNVSREEALQNFKNEFSILKELNHPNIARILDFGYDTQLQKYYFTTEFIAGAEFNQAGENQPVETVEKLIVQVLRAVNYIHNRSVHHFDIKPQNILVSTKDGEPFLAKLIDFGLAALTSPQKRVGTPSYMAPEMIQGGMLDNRTDIYSLGVVLYQLLTGQNPFTAKKVQEVLDKQLHLTPELPSKINPKIPVYWDHIVMRMIEKDPNRRYSQTSLAIRDLNFLSQKNIEIETSDTKLSYLPEKGVLIGRDREWQQFTDLFGRVFFEEAPLNKHILIVTGAKGTGKTRFLSEIKYYSQLKNIPTRNATEIPSNESNADCMIEIDDPSKSPAEINDLLRTANLNRCLIVWSTEAAPSDWTNSTVITLAAYTQEQLKTYIESVTGLEDAPSQLVDDVFKRTGGNPLCVTAFIKALLDQNVLFDANGKWDAATFSDVKIDFNKIKIPNSIEDILKNQWQALSTIAQDILIWIALCDDGLSTTELTALLGHEPHQQILDTLVHENIIQRNREKSFVIKNPLLSTLIAKYLSTQEKQSRSDKLAVVFEKNEARQRDVLTYRAQGSDPIKARSALQILGSLLMKEYHYEEAIAVFERLLDLSGQQFTGDEIDARLKLADALVKTRRYDDALKHYTTLNEHLHPAKHQHETNFLVLKKMIDVYLKASDLANASRLNEEALRLVAHQAASQSDALVFRNFAAWISFKNGAVDEAAATFQETYRIWKEQLDHAQKLIVDNNRLLDILLIKQDYDAATRFCQDNISIFTELNEKFGMAAYHYALGDVYYRMLTDLKRDDKALLEHKSLHHFETCERIARSTQDYAMMLRAFNGMGNLFAFEDKTDKTIKSYERALTLSRQINDYFTAAIIAFNIGNIYRKKNNPDEAYTYLVYAINTLKNIGREYSPHKEISLYYACTSLADIYSARQSFTEAHELLAEADQLNASHEALKPLRFWGQLSWARFFIHKSDAAQANTWLKKSKELKETPEQQEEYAQAIKEYEKTFPLTQATQEVPMSTTTQTPKPNENLKKIIEINKFINSEFNTDQLLKLVLNYAIQLTKAEAGFVLLLQDDGTFSVRSSLNTKKEDEEKISQSIAHRAIEQNEIVVSADALTDDRFDSSESIVLNELKSVVCLPIRSKNKSIGVFYLDNRFRVNAFEDCDLDLLNAFCDQVGIAIENSTLISDLVETKNQLDNKLKVTTEELADVKGQLQTVTEQVRHRYSYKQIIAKGPAMQNVFHILDKVTETNLSVFICGESGTGKELVAKCLHFNNPLRSSKRFVAINCGAIPPNLMESELFGHKAGSFTGANKDQKGLFEEANGGTLFLDEISELDTQLQVKLLRVLQEGEVQRIGDAHTIKVDVRIVCASHKDLSHQTKEGKFREDLYYRLCQMKIDLPPLRNRPEDIPLLANHFIGKFCEQNHIKEEIEVPPAFMKGLLTHAWPGNIRELENLIAVACALRQGNKLSLENLPPIYNITPAATPPTAQPITANLADLSPPTAAGSTTMIDEANTFDPRKTWQQYEAVILAKTYVFTNKKKATTANLLGLSHSTIYNKINELNLDDPNNPLFAESFVCDGKTDMKSYVRKIFQAALQHHDSHPYAAIRQLNVSQGYFYKVMKEFTSQPSSAPVT